MTKLTARPYVELTIKQKCKCEHKYEKKNYTWCKYYYTSKQLLFDTLSLHLKIVIIKVQAWPGQAKLVQLIVMQTWSLLSGAGCLAGLVGWPNCDELSTKEISQLSQCQPALTSIQHIQRVLSII